jgi:AraC-like DNA-binding protein
MRRVREYVAAHLSESTDLAMLAAVAGLSIHHFARGFKQSAGMTSNKTGGQSGRDLPVVQCCKFEFAFNPATAKVLGIEAPSGLVAIADELTE